ncbi:MAG: transporter, family, multidrug resistance protein, partial [Hyphomicrobiales bacterium]|nr:transporter, family, multidrug resistance protein [Hyphomicrobiales bacterium]
MKLAVVAAVFLTAFIWIGFAIKKPLVDLRLLGNCNFGIGTLA